MRKRNAAKCNDLYKMSRMEAMNDFKIVLNSTGLSQREAAVVLDVNYDSLRGWLSGRRNCPEGVIIELIPVAEENFRKVKAIKRRLSKVNET